jgi:general stress protein YciG
MVDISSRDDEKRVEIAREKGRQDEQNSQKDRALATEKGRKLGQQEERARDPQKAGWGTKTKIIVSVIGIILIIAVIGILTLSVSVTNVAPGNALPYTTGYSVSFPEGQTIAIGNTQISVLSNQNELFSNIDGDQQKLVEGESRAIAERRALITTFGAVTVVDTNFQIDLTYKGDRDNRAYFDMAVHTSKQVPDYLLNQLLPPAIDARPM